MTQAVLYFAAGLTRLKTLNLSANSKLSALPSWLGRLQGLKSLTLDTATLTYPSSDITSQGTEAVMKFLASGNNLLCSNLMLCAWEMVVLG